MMIHAVLGNPNHPEYGVVTIPLPIPHDQYAHCMELLEALEIGDAVKADCQVQEINSFSLRLGLPARSSPFRTECTDTTATLPLLFLFRSAKLFLVLFSFYPSLNDGR